MRYKLTKNLNMILPGLVFISSIMWFNTSYAASEKMMVTECIENKAKATIAWLTTKKIGNIIISNVKPGQRKCVKIQAGTYVKVHYSAAKHFMIPVHAYSGPASDHTYTLTKDLEIKTF